MAIMNMNTIMDEVCEHARRVKDATARRGEDMHWTILVHRAGQKVAILQPDIDERDALLLLANVAAFGFDADVLALVMESWGSDSPTNPRTGKPWEHGDMNDLVSNHRGIEHGWVTEGITVQVVNRAGDIRVRGLSFRRGYNKVVWSTPTDLDDTDPHKVVVGVMPDELRNIMLRPSIISKALREGKTAAELGMTIERMYATSDARLTLFLTGADPAAPPGFPRARVTLSAEPGSERAEVFDRM